MKIAIMCHIICGHILPNLWNWNCSIVHEQMDKFRSHANQVLLVLLESRMYNGQIIDKFTLSRGDVDDIWNTKLTTCHKTGTKFYALRDHLKCMCRQSGNLNFKTIKLRTDEDSHRQRLTIVLPFLIYRLVVKIWIQWQTQ